MRQRRNTRVAGISLGVRTVDREHDRGVVAACEFEREALDEIAALGVVGAVLALVRDGDAAASEVLARVLVGLRGRDQLPFDGWRP